MKKKLLFFLTGLLFLLLTGCTSQPSIQKIKELPEVQLFLEMHPNSIYTQKKVPSKFMPEIIGTRNSCNLQIKDYWRTRFEAKKAFIEVWLDTILLKPECIYIEEEDIKQTPDENKSITCTSDLECDDNNIATRDYCDRTTFVCQNELMTCESIGGKICSSSTECTVETIKTKDKEKCCPTACKPLNLCQNVQCPENQKCVQGKCVNKTCFELGGTLCSEGKICSGEYRIARDTENCCIGSCIEQKSCEGIICSYGQECKQGECIDKTISAKNCGAYIQGTKEYASTDCFCEAYSTCNPAKISINTNTTKQKKYVFTILGKSQGTCNVKITGSNTETNPYWQPNKKSMVCANAIIPTNKTSYSTCLNKVIKPLIEMVEKPEKELCEGELIAYKEKTCLQTCNEAGYRWGTCTTEKESPFTLASKNNAGRTISCQQQGKDFCICYNDEKELQKKIDIGDIRAITATTNKLFLATSKGIYTTTNGQKFERELVPENNENFYMVTESNEIVYALSNLGLYLQKTGSEWNFVAETIIKTPEKTTTIKTSTITKIIATDNNIFVLTREHPQKLFYIKDNLFLIADSNELYETASSISTAFNKTYVGLSNGEIYLLEDNKLVKKRKADSTGIENTVFTVYGSGEVLTAGIGNRIEYSTSSMRWSNSSIRTPIETISPGISKKTGKTKHISEFLGKFYAGSENGLFESKDGRYWKQKLPKSIISPANIQVEITGFQEFKNNFYMSTEDNLWVTSDSENWEKITE